LVLIVFGAAVYYLIDVKDGINWLVAVGTIGMTLIITYIEIIKSWIQKPDIRIEFANERPYCRHARTTTGSRPYYCHFVVVNNSPSQADDCEAVLEKIWDWKEKRLGWQERKNFIPVNLKWSAEDPDEDFKRACFKTIYPGGREYFCDIGSVREWDEAVEFVFVLIRPFVSQADFLLPGKYKIQISVYSKNAANVTKKFDVEWLGGWSEKQDEMQERLKIKML